MILSFRILQVLCLSGVLVWQTGAVCMDKVKTCNRASGRCQDPRIGATIRQASNSMFELSRFLDRTVRLHVEYANQTWKCAQTISVVWIGIEMDFVHLEWCQPSSRKDCAHEHVLDVQGRQDRADQIRNIRALQTVLTSQSILALTSTSLRVVRN